LKVLFLSTLPREAPSVRPRVYDYLPALRAAGIEVEVVPFLGDAAFRRFYRPGLEGMAWKVGGSLVGYARRAALLASPGKPDLVFIHREAVPRGNASVLRRLRRLGIPVVYDFDDAIYLSPRDFVREGEDSRAVMTRSKDPREVEGMLRAAVMVLAGNETLAERARDAGAATVRVQPTPVDTDLFRPRTPAPGVAGLPLVGWIGSPTATYCLRDIAPALAAAARVTPFRLLVIGASGRVEVPGVEVEHRDWTLAREATDYASLDVGLYPLPDNPWTRGKCAYKAILYQACGVPCIASPVGMNSDAVVDGVTGVLATDGPAWTDALVRLLGDVALRRRMGDAGRRHVEEHYALSVLAPRMLDALRAAAAQPVGGGVAP
jgi:glycosyltransferase involved in cell wall biosynthesis